MTGERVWGERRRGPRSALKGLQHEGDRQGGAASEGDLVSTGRLVASGWTVHLYFSFWCLEKEVMIGVFLPTLVLHSKNVIPGPWGSVLRHGMLLGIKNNKHFFIITGH